MRLLNECRDVIQITADNGLLFALTKKGEIYVTKPNQQGLNTGWVRVSELIDQDKTNQIIESQKFRGL